MFMRHLAMLKTVSLIPPNLTLLIGEGPSWMVEAICSPSPTAHPTPSPLGPIQPVADRQELSIGSLTWNLTTDIGNSFGEFSSPVQGI